jgi:hypothetical protein
VQTPRFCGQEFKAGALLLSSMEVLPFLTNCCIVGISAFICMILLQNWLAKVDVFFSNATSTAKIFHDFCPTGISLTFMMRN